MLLKLVQQIMKGHCSQPFLRPSGENGPSPIYPRPPGPTAQKPTGGLPKQPAHAARLGQFSAQQPLEAAAVLSHPIGAGSDPTAARTLRWYKRPDQLAPPQNPSFISFLPRSSHAPAAEFPVLQFPSAAGWRCPWPAARWRRRGAPPARGRRRLVPPLFFLFLPLFPSPNTGEHQGKFTAHSGLEEETSAPPRALSR
jgi:hypothetical protein